MLNGDGKRHGVENHIRHVEVVVRLGNLHQLIGIIAIGVAIFHLDTVGGVDIQHQVVKAAVAGHCHRPTANESQRIYIVGIRHRKMHMHIGIAHVGTLHILKKLLAEAVVEFMYTRRHAFERKLELAEVSHCCCRLKNRAKLIN